MGLPDAMARQSALAEIATTQAASDPTAAATLAVENIADDEILTRAILGVVSEAYGNDPDLVREWIDRFPQGPMRDAARAEFNRASQKLLPSPASLPGEDIEDRSPAPSR
jgi:hypothetical protein